MFHQQNSLLYPYNRNGITSPYLGSNFTLILTCCLHSMWGHFTRASEDVPQNYNIIITCTHKTLQFGIFYHTNRWRLYITDGVVPYKQKRVQHPCFTRWRIIKMIILTKLGSPHLPNRLNYRLSP